MSQCDPGLPTSSSGHFTIIFSELASNLTAAVRASAPVIRILWAVIALQCAPKHLLAGLSSSPSQAGLSPERSRFSSLGKLVAGYIYGRSYSYGGLVLCGWTFDPRYQRLVLHPCQHAFFKSSWLYEYSHFSCKKTIIKVTFFPLDSQSGCSSAPGKGRHHRKLIVPVGPTQSEAAYVVSQQSDTDEITKLGVLDDTKPSGTIRVNEHAWRSV